MSTATSVARGRAIARLLLVGARAGFFVGIATGVVAATVDAVYGALNPFRGGLAALVLTIFGLLVPTFAAGGALFGAYLAPLVERSRGERFFSSALTSSLAALPILSFALWVPSGWISEHWPDLLPKQRALVVVALVLIGGSLLIASRILYSITRRWAAGRIRNRWAYVACVLFVLAAAACYVADAVVFQGDYEDFHYGLAMSFVGIVALVAVIVRALVARRRPAEWVPARWQMLFSRFAAPALLAALVLVAVAPVTVFGRSNALVFGKILRTARTLTDVDADGYSSVLGGGDCAPFDARFSPGKQEIPENGIDDDCSGRDARWPASPPRPEPAEPWGRWNVVLVSIDALRADHVGALGYKRKTTTIINRFAARSLVYTEAYSQAPKTTDSLPSLLTGSYPSNVQRDPRAAHRRWKTDFAPEARPLAAILRAHGYSTAAGTGFRLNTLSPGFDSFEIGNPTSTARRFIEKTQAPFFLWLHYAEPHAPYNRHKGIDFGPEAIDRYDGEIAAADAGFGAVLKMLKERDFLDSTIVILTADHGEEFGEHGGFEHTRKLYRELLHVPLMLRIPGMEPQRIDEPVELVDIVPTLCELLHLKLPAGEQDGQSLLVPKRARGLRGAYAEDLRQPFGIVLKRALFDGRYRLIDDKENDRLELYDSVKDKKEQKDIGYERPDVLAKLREALGVRALRRHTETFQTLTPTSDPEIWALLMPTIRHREMVDLALDRFPPKPSPARDAVLQALLARPGLDPEVRARVQRLAAQH